MIAPQRRHRRRHANAATGLAACLALVGLLVTPGCRKFFGRMGHSYVPFTQVSAEQPLPSEVIELQVRARVGEVTVVGDATDTVRVAAQVRIDRDRANTGVPTGTFPDHVRVATEGDRLVVEDAHAGQADEDDWAVSLVVHVPARLAVQAYTGVGEIHVEDVASDVRATGGTGDVTLIADGVGSVELTSGVGTVEAKVGSVRGKVTLNTGTGNVVFRLASTLLPGDVQLKTGVGDVILEAAGVPPGKYQLTAGVGSISVPRDAGLAGSESGASATGSGEVGSGGPPVSLETGVGIVTVRTTAPPASQP